MNQSALRYRSLVLCLAAVLSSGSMALAETAYLYPSQDNTLYEDPRGSLSNGAGERIVVGNDARGQNRRALLMFDIASVIPAGSLVTEVELTLLPWPSNDAPQPVALHRALAPWGEGPSDAPGDELSGTSAMLGDATWMHTFLADQFWSEDGGDFLAEASALTLVGGPDVYLWGPTFELTDDVQGWVDDPASNYGWFIIGNEKQANTIKSFSSGDELIGEYWPLLRVDYEPGDGNGTDDGETDDGESDGESDDTESDAGNPLAAHTLTGTNGPLGLLELDFNPQVNDEDDNEEEQLRPLRPGDTPEHGWDRGRGTQLQTNSFVQNNVVEQQSSNVERKRRSALRQRR